MATVGFKIDGEWLTEHSRDLVTEGRWDHALRTLVDGLEGMPTDIALDILRGDKKLVGVNDLDLEDDNAVEYKKLLDFQYAGTFTDSSGRFLRPYAIVTVWGKDDLVDREDRFEARFNPKSDLAEVSSMGRTRWLRQPLRYADDPRNDVAVRTTMSSEQISTATGLPFRGEMLVICRTIAHYPHMIIRPHGANKIKEAIQELWDRGFPLREVGATDAYTPADDNITDAVEKIINSRPANESFDDRVKRQNREFAARKEFESSLEEYRKMIIEQANGDFFPLTYSVNGEERTIQVPRAPFENWSLWRTIGSNLAKPWKKVSRSGLKMQGDDPYHTDWMLGAGLDLNAMSEEGSTLNDVAFEENFRMQEEILSFEATVLCGDQSAYGKVVHPKAGEEVADDEIAVIPNAGARYLRAALTAKAVIVEQGGAMAHLVSIGREQGVTIMRVEKAREKYPVGARVSLDPQKGKVHLSPITVRDAFGEIDA